MKYLILLLPYYLFSTEIHFYKCDGPNVTHHMQVSADPHIPLSRVLSYLYLNQGLKAEDWVIKFKAKPVDDCLDVKDFISGSNDKIVLTVEKKTSLSTCIYHHQCNHK